MTYDLTSLTLYLKPLGFFTLDIPKRLRNATAVGRKDMWWHLLLVMHLWFENASINSPADVCLESISSYLNFVFWSRVTSNF